MTARAERLIQFLAILADIFLNPFTSICHGGDLALLGPCFDLGRGLARFSFLRGARVYFIVLGIERQRAEHTYDRGCDKSLSHGFTR